VRAIDWIVVAAYGVFLVGVGLWQKRRAAGGLDDYFVSGRRLRWWVAGTSMISASFASDTPLLVSSLVRSKGLWGNWQWWSLGISTILTVFLFAPLWRRSGVLTEAELTEARYAGPTAAALRGFKALYWGVLYNCYAAGALAFVGLGTVLEATTDLTRTQAILMCAGLGGLYAVVSGLWGVVAADVVQFVFAIAGAVLLAVVAVGAAGGVGAIVQQVPPEKLEFFPLHGEGLHFMLSFLLIQWWAWKNTDGGGMLVQRMAACRDEREAVYATLWFNVVHYAVRCWPWVMVGLASIVLLPNVPAQAAYAEVINRYLPAGLRGLVVAWFMAEFMASIAGAMNWGGSLVVNDLYRRFMKKGATERHYLLVARLSTLVVIGGAVLTALVSEDIATAFGLILKMTVGIGLVSAARWLWWRVNAWSEIAALVVSPVLVFLIPVTGWKLNDMESLALIVGGSLIPILVATLATKPEDPMALEAFYRRVRPPGPGWGPIAARCPGVSPSMSLRAIAGFWALGVGAIYGMMFGIGSIVLLKPHGWAALAGGLVLLVGLIGAIRRRELSA
jgi:SSS family solute:Na+ symporter